MQHRASVLGSTAPSICLLGSKTHPRPSGARYTDARHFVATRIVPNTTKLVHPSRASPSWFQRVREAICAVLLIICMHSECIGAVLKSLLLHTPPAGSCYGRRLLTAARDRPTSALSGSSVSVSFWLSKLYIPWLPFISSTRK
ncbi:hypothetical protein OH77DRAFT_749325 [Trametes cingulata]|nr:hypothetical protein OH77DRAFT_749325 [Trametes cingulata]